MAEHDRRTEPWAKSWGLLTSNSLLFAWLGLLILIGGVTFILPQAPRGLHLQSSAFESWLTSIRPQLGRSTDLLITLGLLTVERAPWFRIILAGVVFTLLVRGYAAVLQIVRSPTPDNSSILGRFLFSATPCCSLCLSLGGLLATGGWLWTATSGWELNNIQLVEDLAPLDAGDQTLQLGQFDVIWGDEDSPPQVTGRLLLSDGKQTSEFDIRWKGSCRWQGVSYSLENLGPAISVSGKNTDGAPLQLQTAANRPPVEELTIPLPTDNGLRSFAAPEQGIVVQAEAIPADAPPQVQLRVYQGQAGELVVDQVIDDQAYFVLDGSQLALFLIPFAEFSASYSPGNTLIVVGLILLAIGGLILWCRLWLDRKPADQSLSEAGGADDR